MRNFNHYNNLILSRINLVKQGERLFNKNISCYMVNKKWSSTYNSELIKNKLKWVESESRIN